MPAVVSNPFIGLAKGIGPNESIAFVVVYGLYTIALVVRMWGTRWAARPNHMSVYRFQVIFGVGESPRGRCPTSPRPRASGTGTSN